MSKPYLIGPYLQCLMKQSPLLVVIGWGKSSIFVIGALVWSSMLSGCQAWETRFSDDRTAVIEGSPEWRDGRFRNAEPSHTDLPKALLQALSGAPEDVPVLPVAVALTDPALLARSPDSGLRVTWFGHSSTLLEIDGVRILTDPIWSERASPVGWLGPRRWYAPTIALSQFPRIDAVLISHDHYDHLDEATIVAMRHWSNLFIVPLGVGARLERWGIAPARIVELGWWQSTRVGALEVSLVPARHSSGRLNPRSDHTLWGGYALRGPQHRVYFSGDTGLQNAMTEIGRRYGPFDLALIEAGQYSDAWPDAHLGPEQAVLAAKQVKARRLLPVHWGLFKLAPHGWTEPVERVLAAARCTSLAVITPRPGQSVEPTAPRPEDAQRWWPTLRWMSSEERPIIATIDGDPADRFAPITCRDASAPWPAASHDVGAIGATSYISVTRMR
ncbi:MBL fold metallo-hydrolase [Duganella margarita]|nr:MBL fold metallo-hydrolase [Duganella margarita]